jgi:hypothetical protein
MVVWSVNANAQKTIVGNVNDFAACKSYLDANPADTITNDRKEKVWVENPAKFAALGVQAGDTILRDTIVYVLAGRVVRQPHYIKTVVIYGEQLNVLDAEAADKTDRAAARTQTAYKLAAGKKQDVLYYQSNMAALTDGKVVKRACDKYGWGVGAEGGYRSGTGLSAFTFAAGPTLSWNWGRADLMFRYARSVYSFNAQHADENYDTYGGRLGGYLKILSFDDYKTMNLYLGGGVGFDFFKTDSKERETKSLLQSNGSEAYGFANVMLTKRFFATGNELYVKAGWEQNPLIIQNGSTQHIDCWTITLGGSLGLLRHLVSTK